MKNRLLRILIFLLLAGPVRAGTVQEDFNAAQARLDAGDYAAARTGFAALLDRMGASKSRSVMIVHNRLGEALLALGEIEAAQDQHETALKGLPAGIATAADERATALTQLALIDEQLGHIGTAMGRWQAILAENLLPEGSSGQLQAQMGVARTAIWRSPRAAESAINGLMALTAASWGGDPTAATRARLILLRLKARLAMHEARLDDARALLDEAGKLAGGTSSLTVNFDDVSVRSDLALLAWLRKDMASVAKFSAMSGANMLDDGTNRGGAGGTLPPCAPLGTLAPDAMALIEFSVRDDGTVLNVQPVYAHPGSGPADSHPEEEFAAAVRSWSWPAEQAKALNPLWRAAIRVEVRCLTKQPDIVWPSLFKDHGRWLQARSLAMPDTSGTDAQRRKRDLDALAAVDAGGGAQSPAAVPLLAALVLNPAVSGKENKALAKRLEALADAHDAPVLVRWLAARGLATSADSEAADARRFITMADQRGEARMADYLRLSLMANRNGPAAEADLAAIADRHPDGDPLRTQALIMLSDRAFARGDEAVAASALARTGLSDQQCTLVDVRPQSRNAAITYLDFPPAALNWGLSAYLRASHDITPAGKTTNVRVVMARPPFVFSDAVVKRTQTWTFKPVLRGTETVGCQGRSFPVRFRSQ